MLFLRIYRRVCVFFLTNDPNLAVPVKPYVPTFVIHAGEKTYEIVQNAQEATVKNVNATTGYIVTKVNGTVNTITSVPAIGALIDKLNSLTAPVLARFGVMQADGSVQAEEPAAATPAANE